MNTTQTQNLIKNALNARGVFPTGNVFYVCNATATGSRATGVDAVANGRSPNAPLATINYAIGLCTAANGDVIIVLPGHAETVNAAGFITCSVSGVTIIGVGNGRNRPVLTWATSTAATIVVSTNNVSLKNLVFVGTGIDAVVTMFSVATADDFTIDGCEFDIANATNQISLGITITGCDRFTFTNNRVHGTADAGCTNFIQSVGAASKQKDYYIANNDVIGAFTTSLGFFNNITTAMVNATFRENHIVNLTASATKCIVCLTASTGKVMNNRFGIGSGAAPVTMDAGWWCGNWSAAAVATNGTLV